MRYCYKYYYKKVKVKMVHVSTIYVVKAYRDSEGTSPRNLCNT
jgi:hypothetical protein